MFQPVRHLAKCALLAATLVGTCPAHAEEPAQAASVQPAQMDTKTAASIARRERTAWITLSVGSTATVAFASMGMLLMQQKSDECDKLPDATYEKADCMHDSAAAAEPWMALSGVALVGTVTGFSSCVLRQRTARRRKVQRRARSYRTFA